MAYVADVKKLCEGGQVIGKKCKKCSDKGKKRKVAAVDEEEEEDEKDVTLAHRFLNTPQKSGRSNQGLMRTL